MEKWATAFLILVLMVAPVPLVAGLAASGIALAHTLPWALRAS